MSSNTLCCKWYKILLHAELEIVKLEIINAFWQKYLHNSRILDTISSFSRPHRDFYYIVIKVHLGEIVQLPQYGSLMFIMKTESIYRTWFQITYDLLYKYSQFNIIKFSIVNYMKMKYLYFDPNFFKLKSSVFNQRFTKHSKLLYSLKALIVCH